MHRLFVSANSSRHQAQRRAFASSQALWLKGQITLPILWSMRRSPSATFPSQQAWHVASFAMPLKMYGTSYNRSFISCYHYSEVQVQKRTRDFPDWSKSTKVTSIVDDTTSSFDEVTSRRVFECLELALSLVFTTKTWKRSTAGSMRF